MPVEIPSLRGKCEYEVETAINRLAGALNQLEGTVSREAIAQMHRDLATVSSGLNSLTQRFDRLYGACHDAGII